MSTRTSKLSDIGQYRMNVDLGANTRLAADQWQTQLRKAKRRAPYFCLAMIRSLTLS